MNKVLIIDTSILCVWLRVPGKEKCGSKREIWDWNRVDKYLQGEVKKRSTLVLPLATILETGNHISQVDGNRYDLAQQLAELIKKAADEKTPWAAFTDQTPLWNADNLKKLAESWPDLAASRLSIGDATIKQVAEYYARMRYDVEILTGDEGLKAYQPTITLPVPRRRR